MTTAKTPATARKTAAPRKRAAKAVAAPQSAVPATSGDDPQNVSGWTFTRPVGAAEFVSTGQGPALDRLTPRALANLTELATDKETPESEGNTPQARRYWTRVLSRYGVKV